MNIKRIFSVLLTSAIVALAFTSCAKKVEETISVSSVTVSPVNVEIIEGESAKLTAKISPEAATDRAVAWTSSDKSVATVDDSGNVAGLAAGSATVTAAVEGHSATCQVIVKKKEEQGTDPEPKPDDSYVEKERQALIAFYKANNGDSWKYKDNWCGSKPVSEWYGVKMTEDGKRVRSIVLNDGEVYGRIPDEIVDLEMLEELRITNYGEEPEQSYPLPEAIGKLKYLKKLYFQSYPTGGRLPEAIFDLANLEELRLKLTEAQPMPASIAKLTKLKVLDLGGSKLTGSLIPELWNLHELTELKLWGCGLTGSIPAELGGLANLKTIDLSTNKLSGVIPVEVSRLGNFWNLWTGIVFGNNFTQKDIEDSHLPAPKAFQTIALDGSAIDLEQEFGKNRYTVLMHVNPKSGNAQGFIERLSTFYDKNKNKDKGLGVITYFDNNNPKDKNANVADFKNILSTFHVGWKSFASWMYKDGQREFYTERGKSMYPHASENSVVIIGPDRTVAYTTLPDKSSDKLDNVLAYLSDVFGSKEEYYESKDYSADGKVITLQKATTGNGADIVITGDAFSDRLIADGTLRKMADDAVNGIFSTEPLKSLKDRFNVYLVNAVSKNEEYTNATSTAFNGTFGNGSACGGDLDKVLEYSKKAVGASRMNDVTVLVLMNSYRSAGTTYMLKPSYTAGYGEGASVAFLPYKSWNSTGYTKEDLNATLIHELVGHGIGKLDDEYSYSSLGRIPQNEIDYIKGNQEKYGWYMNTDFTSNPDKVKWSDFLKDSRYKDENLGVFEGSSVYALGAYRPTENSMMRYQSISERFNAPSRQAIWIRVMRLSEGSSWTPDHESFVKWDQAHKATTTAITRTSSPACGRTVSAPSVFVDKTWEQILR